MLISFVVESQKQFRPVTSLMQLSNEMVHLVFNSCCFSACWFLKVFQSNFSLICASESLGFSGKAGGSARVGKCA